MLDFDICVQFYMQNKTIKYSPFPTFFPLQIPGNFKNAVNIGTILNNDILCTFAHFSYPFDIRLTGQIYRLFLEEEYIRLLAKSLYTSRYCRQQSFCISLANRHWVISYFWFFVIFVFWEVLNAILKNN